MKIELRDNNCKSVSMKKLKKRIIAKTRISDKGKAKTAGENFKCSSTAPV
jgi:hypothetical protein